MKVIPKTIHYISFLLLFGLLLCGVNRKGWAQEITLKECLVSCRSAMPLVQQLNLIEQSTQFGISNAAKGYLPRVSLSGQATYQSDVTKLPIELPYIAQLSKDHYTIAFQISQLIWDGGRIAAAQQVEQAQANVQREQIEVKLYALREQVIELYFGTLLLEEQLKLNKQLLEQLELDHKRLQALLEEGIIESTDLDVLDVQREITRQQQAELQTMYTHSRTMLQHLSGIKIAETSKLTIPERILSDSTAETLLPEQRLFQTQQMGLLAERKMLRAQLLPVVELFGQAAYGRPNLNMLSNDFVPFAIGGIRFSWDFGAWYQYRGNSERLSIKQQSLTSSLAAFNHQRALAHSKEEGEIARFETLAQHDHPIIELRERIRRAAQVKLDKGVLDATQYTMRLTEEFAARSQESLHRLQALAARYKHYNARNILER